MILVVTLNPALDLTYEVAGVDWAGVNRPAVGVRPGGKGINVARTLRALGADMLVVGMIGGPTGEAVRAALSAAGVPATFAVIVGETRRTVTVVDTQRHQAALFNEPGPEIGEGEYERLCVLYKKALAGFGLPACGAARREPTRSESPARGAPGGEGPGDGALACEVVVLTGSLPPGLAPDSYAELTGIAAAAGVPVLLDAGGAALRQGARAGPAIVTPNLAELESAVGRPLGAAGRADIAAVMGAARELLGDGARAVVVSLGSDGLVAITGGGSWRATPPLRVTGNPTGAGDALAAGLAHGLAAGRGWAERLRHAVALGAATAAAPVAGEFDPDDYERALAGVRITQTGDA